MTEHDILLNTRDGHVATLTMNRPDKFNALSEELLAALQHALESAGNDDSIRVIVIAATGRAFCAGHDLKQMRGNHSKAYYDRLFAQCSNMMQTIGELPQPVIASVQGLATAAGCQLVATCDLAIAAQSARFAVSGVNLGLFCSTPAVALSRNVARKRSLEMLLTGDFIDADTAVDYGLINRASADDELASEVATLAARISAKPGHAVRHGKAMFYRQLQQPIGDAYTLAADVMACNMMEADTVEGVDAFLEKRAPVFARRED